MRLYRDPDHPLRIYLAEEVQGELSYLRLSLDNKYSPPDNSNYSYSNDDEVLSILFVDDQDRVYFVFGLLNIILKELDMLNISINNEVAPDLSELEYPEIDENLLDGISLRDYQLEGISASLAYKRGIVQVCTGGGKTEMMIGVSRYLLEHSDKNILICVPTTNLLYQTQERILQRGIPESEVSLLGDGNNLDPSKRILISTVASAYKRLDVSGEYMEWLSDVCCLMMDEAHHSKCRTWSTLIDRVAPDYLLGFSAEPFHRDKNHLVSDLILRGLFGPVVHRVTMNQLIELGFLSKPYVLAVDSSYKGNIFKVVDWKIVNKSCIVNNELRNKLICDIASLLINDDKKPLILVQQIAHGKTIAELISKAGYNVYMMTGGMKISVYLDGNVIDTYVDNDNLVVKDFNDGRIDVLIGTSTLDEGVDIPSLSSVILAGGGKGRLKVIQRIGRAMRKKAGLNTTFIFDFRDRFNLVTKSQFTKRKSLYDELNIDTYFCESNTEKIQEMIRSLEYARSVEIAQKNPT